MHTLEQMATDVHSDFDAPSLAYVRWWLENGTPKCEAVTQKNGDLMVVPIRPGQAFNIIRDLLEFLNASR